jgi:hypothetical protein
MQREMKPVLLALVLLAGCASTPRVRTDSAPGVDLSRYRTYSWLQMPETQSPLVRQRIVDTIDHTLQGKRWHRSDTPDVLLAAHVASHEDQTFETLYESPQWNAYRGADAPSVGDARAVVRVQRYTVGTLIVDMLDARTHRVLRRATAEGWCPSPPEDQRRDRRDRATHVRRPARRSGSTLACQLTFA